MSEPIEKTAAGATRTLFGSLGFILLMVGVEGMTGIAPLPLLWAIPLIAIGVFCVYAAVFWENAKRIFSAETREAIAQFAQNPGTRFGMLALVLLTIIFSPFIEQHRWPFSYPADSAVYEQINDLRVTESKLMTELSTKKEAATKWRFIHELHSSLGDMQCRYSIYATNGARHAALFFWQEQIRDAGWSGGIDSAVAPDGSIPRGITIRTASASSPGYMLCASNLQKAITDVYSDLPVKVTPDQTTTFLRECGEKRIQIDMNY